MEVKGEYDFIIAGAGASGLSLLWRMMRSDAFSGKRILLVDNAFVWNNHKTWCFWDDTFIPETSWIDYQWKFIEVATEKGMFETTGRPQYFSIHSKHFREKILREANESGRVTFLEAIIHSFDEVGDKAFIKTSDGFYSASCIFKSTTSKKLDSAEVIQHFKGFFIQTNNPVFEHDRMILMDFRLDGYAPKETAFFYVLPFSNRTALVEYTLFSGKQLLDSAYDDVIKTYLKQRLELSENDYTITETEFGVIPMSDAIRPTKEFAHIIEIGTVGGATKSTTGYTFTRIQQHCDDIINALERGETPSSFPKSQYRFRMYDRLLLDILKNNPTEGPRIFKRLIERNRLSSILTFLDEKSTLLEEMALFYTLPWRPFLVSLLKHLFRLHRI